MDIVSYILGRASVKNSDSSGGSSGGGSLSAGLYWDCSDYKAPNNYRQTWFEYNGELYAVTNTSATVGNTYNAYKYSDGGWNIFVTGGSWSAFSSPLAWTFIEFNGKVHILGNDYDYHYVFDGSTFTLVNTTPNDFSVRSVFIQDSKLKAYSYYDGIVYVWDEDTDTWSSEATIGSKYAYYYFCNIDDKVYAAKSKTLYEYKDGALTQIGTTSISANNIFSHNGCIYYYTNVGDKVSGTYTYRNAFYKFDPSTYEESFVGYGPYASTSVSNLCVVQDEVFFIAGDTSDSPIVCVQRMNEVTE